MSEITVTHLINTGLQPGVVKNYWNRLNRNNILTNHTHYVGAAMYLNAFVSDEKADRLNRGGRSLQNEEYFQYTTSIVSIEIKAELDRFIEQVKAHDKDDPLFQQRVYTLVGLE